MKVIDVYNQYFEAQCEYNGVMRHAAAVTLTATSDAGTVKYEAAVSFFPHNGPDDFGITFDAYSSIEIYCARGRRSKKRERVFLENIQESVNLAAEKLDGAIFWDKPLSEAVYD